MFEDENRHYGLRKLSVGLASVLIGISFASTTGNSVKADTVKGNSNSVQTVVKGSDAAVKIDAKGDAKSAESNTESAPKTTKKDPNAIAQDIKQKAVKASEAVTKLQGTAEKTTKGNTSEAAAKNVTDGNQAAVKSTAESTLEGSANAGKEATVEADKQSLETPVVSHSNSNETILNVKDSKVITGNVLKEGKAEVEDSQAGADPAKSKLKMATLKATTGKKFDAKMLFVSKVVSPANDTNGGFDSSWGKLNVNDWQGRVQGDYYQLTNYTGDANHVIVPNEADFAKAGISTSGKQVGVTSDLMHTIFADKATAEDETVAFSKTDNKMVKAINADWSDTWNKQNYNDTELSQFDGTNLDVSNVTDMQDMFLDCRHLSDISSLANWDTSNVTNMSGMFLDCFNLSDISSLANWDTSNVTNMSGMFSQCFNLSNISSLANWDTSNVTNMSGMFARCFNLSDISSLANWDTSNVTDMSAMFRDCYNNLSDISPLANWDTSNITDMSDMFSGCKSLSDISSLAHWDTSNVTNMASVFSSCESLSDIRPLTNWDTSKVTDMSYMFSCKSLSDIRPLAKWDTSNVTDMEGMFNSCESLSDIRPLANWDTSNVTKMSMMFEDGGKLSDISSLANWNTSKVIDMAGMFENTSLKKVTLTNWDFSNVAPFFLNLFPHTNFEATLSDKTSKSLLSIASEISDQAKEPLKVVDSAPIVDGMHDSEGQIQDYLDSIKKTKAEYQQQLAKYKQQIDHYKKELADPNADAATKKNSQDELKQAEQKYQYYLTGDGKKEYDEQIQDLQGELEQYKQKLQQVINHVKLQAEYPLDSAFGNLSKITTSNRDLLVYLVGKLPVKSDAATRTIEITFPDGTKKTINQSVGYGKYVISGTADMATHKLDMAMPYELSKWELIKKEDGSYDLIKAHVDKNGVASFDDIQLPQIPGYKAVVKTVANPVNPASALFAVSFMALPKPVAPAINDTKPAETISPTTPAATEIAEPIKTEPKVVITPKVIDLSNDAVTTTPDVSTWHVADEPDQDTYRVSNGQYAVELPHISNAQLHVIANDSTKDSILFTYKRQNAQYAFKIKFVNGHYLLTTYEIKSDKLVKLIDYNFIKVSNMIDVILDWLKI